MNSSKLNAKSSPNNLGILLRRWRDVRGRSQLDLSLETGVSQRHISFIESGRSAPSRETLSKLSQALDVPFRERNILLHEAGYAPIYAAGAWDAADMQSVTSAMERMMRQHDPFPAMLMDRYWNVLMTNESAPRFFNCFVDMSKRPSPRNMLHLIFDPDGMRPFIADWDNVATSLIQRLHRESIGRVVDDRTAELLAALLAYPEVETKWQRPDDLNTLPVIPINFVMDGRVLRYFSMITTVGAPQTIAAQELRLESMFPADDATESYHLEMMANLKNTARPTKK
jgi:transcriptional regulator with XRE-family HTH domain